MAGRKQANGCIVFPRRGQPPMPPAGYRQEAGDPYVLVPCDAVTDEYIPPIIEPVEPEPEMLDGQLEFDFVVSEIINAVVESKEHEEPDA